MNTTDRIAAAKRAFLMVDAADAKAYDAARKELIAARAAATRATPDLTAHAAKTFAANRKVRK